MNTITKRGNRGLFKKGHDPRRHRFSLEECQRGFLAALTSIIARYLTAIDASGRHMEGEKGVGSFLEAERFSRKPHFVKSFDFVGKDR
ncbi:MAG TPA: hypothetical protein VJ810_02305 [Blastocatellia bacterium]|nr:hypothetical protein [Blastocatellia bacterium]